MTWTHRSRLWLRRVFGIDVSRYDIARSGEARIARLCAVHGIDTVLDVGANVGDYARGLIEAGFTGRVLSFEPLTIAHSALLRQVGVSPRWAAAPRMAIGDRRGDVDIYVADNVASSSLREMLPRHLTAAPESRYVGTERVQIERLDAVEHPFINEASAILIKSDTQGFEKQVLSGAAGLMARVSGVQLELSLVALYDGQSLFRELYDELITMGFELWYVAPVFSDPESGRTLQVDGVFFRSP